MNTERDTKVSEAYREVATETAPAALDEQILGAARREARTRYGLARAWVRPVAWAATNALSFAFILEMTYFSEDPLFVDHAMPVKEEQRIDRDVSPATIEESAKRTRAPVVAAPAFKVEDSPVLQEAEELAGAASADAANRVAPSSFAAPADDAQCGFEARQDAESWYACILALRDRGLDEAASAELERLLEAFPEFEVPKPE